MESSERAKREAGPNGRKRMDFPLGERNVNSSTENRTKVGSKKQTKAPLGGRRNEVKAPTRNGRLARKRNYKITRLEKDKKAINLEYKLNGGKKRENAQLICKRSWR
ncbi:hypothetical protein NPIL_516381 [Nephila pilipes]|uniref:Uncharacterized protein n=1 Tax=Nephila pilipes TaxID=299642 RepID=A0A8X6NXG4_NEPPI|nr:hypothetical protein NPIL_516381 [Nephila pilipes]